MKSHSFRYKTCKSTLNLKEKTTGIYKYKQNMPTM